MNNYNHRDEFIEIFGSLPTEQNAMRWDGWTRCDQFNKQKIHSLEIESDGWQHRFDSCEKVLKQKIADYEAKINYQFVQIDILNAIIEKIKRP